MVDQNLLSDLDVLEGDLNAELQSLFVGEDADAGVGALLEGGGDEFRPGTILTGRIVGRSGDDVVVDVGLKSEGLVPIEEWDDPSGVDEGDDVQVWLEHVESDSGHIILSKRKADRLLNWQRLVETKNEGDTVNGRVMRKIKGGLLVDIGYPVFLPASQVDVRRPGDIGEYIGRDIQAKILKIDPERRNIVISRRKLIDEERMAAKTKLLATLEIGQVRKGVVKNIADFGVFVDLGGIDGLLHITDMSWDRVGHPSEVVKIDEDIEIKILNIDLAKEKIALGLKQLQTNPWEEVEQRYPPKSKLNGEVVNITNYGAFVKIDSGVEGLVHISEMSWTRRISHPSEVLAIGDMVDVIVLDVNKDKHEISLGIKQTQENPWEHVAEKYPPNTRISGRVRNLTNYGAFVEIEDGIDGLLHVSDMSWTKKVNHPSELLKKSDTIDCVVLAVDRDRQRIALGLKQLHEDPWEHAVLENYIPGQIVEGTVTKITNFGVFVELEEDLEGLLHVSELADHKVEDPHLEVNIGDRILVKILRVDAAERKIGLSKKRAEWSAEQEAESGETVRPVRRGGLEGPGALSTDRIVKLSAAGSVPAPTTSADSATPDADAAAVSKVDTGSDRKEGEDIPADGGDVPKASTESGTAEAGADTDGPSEVDGESDQPEGDNSPPEEGTAVDS